MAIDYNFQPVDVNLTTHPKAFDAGVEAMGLWLWGALHSRQHKTRGVLSRSAVMGAWGGKRNAQLAKKLETAGLWIRTEDGWEIHNWDRKAPGSSPSVTKDASNADRQRRFRERQRELKRQAEDVTRDGNGDDPRNVTNNALRETRSSLSLSNSLSGSDLDQEDPAEIDHPTLDTPLPEWGQRQLDAVAMNTGTQLDGPEVWGKYVARRLNEGRRLTEADFRGWVWDAAKYAKRDRIREADRRRGAEATKQPFDPNAPWLKEQAG